MNAVNTVLKHLGNDNIEEFMTKHWQVSPRLFRNAIPNFKPVCSIDDLLKLSALESVESRLIQNQNKQWSMTHGPFKTLPSKNTPGWTLLIQGANLHIPLAHQLLEQFRFVPDARLDDIMISFATDQGGVGPHFDSYDVFLLQMHGQRHWRISNQSKLDLQANLPLKILKHFEPTEQWILNPGDMLYLPPHIAHDGIAIGPCTTISIGFRSPSAAELMANAFRQMADDIENCPQYNAMRFSDPKRGVCNSPAQLPEDLHQWLKNQVKHFKHNENTLCKSLLIYCTEPKSNVFFTPMDKPCRPMVVLQALTNKGIELLAQSRILLDKEHFALNGEIFYFENEEMRNWITALANQRKIKLSPKQFTDLNHPFLHWCKEMLEAGWVQICRTNLLNIS